MIKKIHFIGIGGISMSGLAEIVHSQGFIVSGSDRQSSHTTAHLEQLGIQIFYGHSKANITQDIDLVVYTAAIAKDNPELLAAKDMNISLSTRSEFLGSLMKSYSHAICISGTHGKTTTTSMLSHALLAANLDPTITVGGILKSIGGNIRVGKSDYFITEACEYCDSFLDFYPQIGIILNIEEDHLDYFENLDHIYDSFHRFAKLIPPNGFLAINGDSVNVSTVTRNTSCLVETFGLHEKCDWYAQNITYDEKACAHFDVYYRGNYQGNISLSAPGEHNIYNCLSVCAVCHFLDITVDTLNEGLSAFKGANQRFEIKGNIHGVTIVDDYAHHPTEMKATLQVAKVYPHKKLFVVFQPHTYTRAKAFLKEFATILSHVDYPIITDIYAAREKNPGDIHAKSIVDKMLISNPNALYMDDFEAIADYLLSHASSGDLIITMGAGNVNQIADILLGNM